MTSKRESILAQIETNLAGTTGVSTRIYRERVTPISRNESSCLVIEPVTDAAAQNVTLPKLDWTLQVRVVIIVRGSASSTPYEVADPICKSVHSKMTADLTLNGNAMDVVPTGVDFDMVDSDHPAGVITTNWMVRYRTSLTDLTT